LLLIAVPIVPGFLPALGAYLARMALSQMDVPTRQAYLAGIVGREERTAANAATNTARNLAQSIGPFSSGALVSALSLSVPFFVGGGLKIVYDLAVFSTFRKTRPGRLCLGPPAVRRAGSGSSSGAPRTAPRGPSLVSGSSSRGSWGSPCGRRVPSSGHRGRPLAPGGR